MRRAALALAVCGVVVEVGGNLAGYPLALAAGGALIVAAVVLWCIAVEREHESLGPAFELERTRGLAHTRPTRRARQHRERRKDSA